MKSAKKIYQTSFLNFFVALFLSFFAFVFLFSACKPNPKGKSDVSEFCYLNIRYYYNDEISGKVQSAQIGENRELTFYSGSKLDPEYNTFENLSGGLWKSEDTVGYGYKTESTIYKFYADSQGFYNFNVLDSNGNIKGTWNTGKALPTGDFIITPIYDEVATTCTVMIFYKSTSARTPSRPVDKRVTFTIPYGTRLCDYNNGTPSGWTSGAWASDESGEYSYTDGTYDYILANTLESGKKIYQFTIDGVGTKIDSTFAITSANVYLNAVYRNTSYVDVTIKYVSGVDNNGRYDSEIYKTFVMHVLKNDTLEKYGTPTDWSNGEWKTDEDGRYSYLIRDTGGYRKWTLNVATDGGYWFKDSNNQNFTSKSIITSDLTLNAVYYSENIDVGKEVDVSCFVNQLNAQTGQYETVRKIYKYYFSKTETGTKTLDIDSYLPICPLDEVLGHGYVDYSDNKRAYSFIKIDGNYNFTDRNSNSYTQTINISSLPSGTTTLTPVYVKAGYAVENVELASNITIPFVFIPGNNDIPWPYSQQAVSGNQLPYDQDRQVGVPSYTDELDAFHPIPNMYFSQMSLNQDEAAAIYAYNVQNRLGYKFISDAVDENGGGLMYKDYKYIPWNNICLYDALAMCNLMTDIYNIEHPDLSEPLTYAYKYRYNGSSQEYVFRDATIIPANPESFVIVLVDDSAKGFRLPTHSQWEYAARIVTDERQLPNDKTYLMRLEYGEKYYFQRAKDSGEVVSTADYIGSGAGLAYYEDGAYKPLVLRTSINALGHNAEASFPNFRQKLGNVSSVSDIDYNAIDYNLRNGAGLFNMSGTIFQLNMTYTGWANRFVSITGGSLLYPFNRTFNRLAYYNLYTITTDSDNKSLVGMRVCRYL